MAKRAKFDPKKVKGARGGQSSQGALFSSQLPAPSPASTVPSADNAAVVLSHPRPEKPDSKHATSRTISVSRLSEMVAQALASGVATGLRVIGETSGFRERTHWYFDLKDTDALVPCVMFQSAWRKARLTLGNGDRVVVHGRVDYYAKAGKVSFIVEKIEHAGAGPLDAQLRKLVEELRGLGWLDASRKRPVPVFPRNIAVITSASGAALQDVLVTMRKRCPGVGVVLIDARVQGEAASEEVARAVRFVSERAHALSIDALLVTRGGGSMEDLWAFNSKELARAIVECSVPVVAAIGHETDVTIAELVADERCATPTQAAVRLTPDRAALSREVAAWGSRLTALARARAADREKSLGALSRDLRSAVRVNAAREGQRLARCRACVRMIAPAHALARAGERLRVVRARLVGAGRQRATTDEHGRAGRRLRDAVVRRVTSLREGHARRAAHLEAVSPQRVLERGFSITSTPEGELVSRVAQARTGATLVTRLRDGSVRSVVRDGQEQSW